MLRGQQQYRGIRGLGASRDCKGCGGLGAIRGFVSLTGL